MNRWIETETAEQESGLDVGRHELLKLTGAGVAAYNRAAEPKELVWVPGAGHVDLYDRVDLIPFDKLTSFFSQHLSAYARATYRPCKSSIGTSVRTSSPGTSWCPFPTSISRARVDGAFACGAGLHHAFENERAGQTLPSLLKAVVNTLGMAGPE